MPKIYLVRHARIKLDDNDDRFWSMTDIPLSGPGIIQAEKLRDRLSEEKIDAVYSSSLSRARQTAEIVASRQTCTVNVSEELNEINFGFIEGLTYKEIQDLYPDLAETLSGFGTIVRFPGGDSFADLESRIKAFVDRLNGHQPEDTILIVSHGGTLPLMICLLLGIGPEHWRKIWLEPASLSIVKTYPGGIRLSLLNDVSHTKQPEVT